MKYAWWSEKRKKKEKKHEHMKVCYPSLRTSKTFMAAVAEPELKGL